MADYFCFISSIIKIQNSKSPPQALASVAQLVGASSREPKSHWFDSQSGHIPRLQVRSPVRARAGDSRSMFPSLSLSLSLPPFPSL